MKTRFYTFYVSALIAVMLLTNALSVAADEALYEDNFTSLDPSWGTPGERLSVKDGKLTLKPGLNTTQSILNQSNVFDDADISVEVSMPAGDANACPSAVPERPVDRRPGAAGMDVRVARLGSSPPVLIAQPIDTGEGHRCKSPPRHSFPLAWRTGPGEGSVCATGCSS